MEPSRALVVLAVAATLAVAAAFVVWLQTRDVEPAASPTPPSSSTPAIVIGGTPSATLVTTAPSIPVSPVDFQQFHSPTGNIGCVLTTEGAHCQIGEYDYELPPEPPDCDAGWAATFGVDADPAAPATLGACQSDTLLGAGHELPYGTTTAVGDFSCLSQETGMTCSNQATEHGFTVSRAAYALF